MICWLWADQKRNLCFVGNDTLWKHSLMKKILHKRNLQYLNVLEIKITFFVAMGKNKECVEQFEKAKIFDGLTIYEAEPEIEV